MSEMKESMSIKRRRRKERKVRRGRGVRPTESVVKMGKCMIGWCTVGHRERERERVQGKSQRR